MKTKKLNQKTVTNSAVNAGGLVLGFGVSGAGNALVPMEHRKAARFAMVAAGIAGAALLPDTDVVSALAKAAAAGVASHSAYQLLSAELQKKVAPAGEGSNIVAKIKAGAVGLACACDQPMGIRNAVQYPRIPVETIDTRWNADEDTYEYERPEMLSLLA